MHNHTLSRGDLHILIDDAIDAGDIDRYTAEWSSSTVFIDPDDPAEPDWERIASMLRRIWQAAHASIKDLRAKTGLTQAQFAAHYRIPSRTLQRWEAEDTCPLHTRLLLAKDVYLNTKEA